jgi:alpha-beta hydrolase superfamily lysophospholipase
VTGFADAEAVARRGAADDERNPAVRAAAGTRLWSHGERRPRAVLLLHGYTHTPQQLGLLAEQFFARGYNVLVPRAPLHGLVSPPPHARLTVAALRVYASDAWRLTTHLGAEAGVVGISGGAVLGTWLAAHRAGEVRRLLALAPFFRPHRRHAPPIAVAAMRLAYGSRLLPDRVDRNGYSYVALAQYLRLAATVRTRPGAGPHRVAVVLSAGDEAVDRATAFGLPAALAAATGASFEKVLLPATMRLPHDIVSPAAVGAHRDDLYARYLDLYEGAPSTAHRPGIEPGAIG